VFRKKIGENTVISPTMSRPESYDNVEFIRHDKIYGDIFFAWGNAEEDNFTIFFGERGNEFD